MAKKFFVKVNKDRHGGVVPVSVNGRIVRLTPGEAKEVDEATLEALKISNVSFEETDEGAPASGGVRSGEAPELGSATQHMGESASDETFSPAMEPRSTDNSGGDQPGDVTTLDVPASSTEKPKKVTRRRKRG